MFDQLAAFFADRVGHDDFHLVALYRSDKSQPDALIAACRLDDYGIFVEQSLFFCVTDHVECGAGLDRTADVQSFEFYKDLCAIRIGHMVKANNRRVADCV